MSNFVDFDWALALLLVYTLTRIEWESFQYSTQDPNLLLSSSEKWDLMKIFTDFLRKIFWKFFISFSIFSKYQCNVKLLKKDFTKIFMWDLMGFGSGVTRFRKYTPYFLPYQLAIGVKTLNKSNFVTLKTERYGTLFKFSLGKEWAKLNTFSPSKILII